jgi:hypothetical protein
LKDPFASAFWGTVALEHFFDESSKVANPKKILVTQEKSRKEFFCKLVFRFELPKASQNGIFPTKPVTKKRVS